ncbi:MAG: octaprenyl diphosphate synthase [Gammaproteobacteria bacterium]
MSELPSFETIRALIDDDMKAVDALINKRLTSDVALINQLGSYIIGSGGKRLRPMIVLLAARACGYEGEDHIKLATIVELIHTATLLHDDVVDESDLRRGRNTANAVWGNAAAVLVGDFLYSRSFQMMTEVEDMKVMEILADCTNTIAEGEVLQLVNCHDADTTEERYLDVIHFKTAKLFEAGARLGAVITKKDEDTEQALAAYGMYLGTAFQLIDDVLDYESTAEEMGKNLGDDLAEGKPTLPLIYAMRTGSESERQVVREAIESGGLEHIDAILAAIESTQAIAYTAASAEREAKLAASSLSALPPSEYRDALEALAQFSVHRTH